MAESLANNVTQAKSPNCGHYVQKLREDRHLIRVYCSACEETQSIHYSKL